jgi:hypothetical protein
MDSRESARRPAGARVRVGHLNVVDLNLCHVFEKTSKIALCSTRHTEINSVSSTGFAR